MKEIIIQANDANQRLDRFLSKAFDSMPKSLMYKYIRTKRIKVNGKRAEISTRLSEGDCLSLYINDELLTPSKPRYDFLSSPTKLDIVYEDENLMLVNKPEGLVVHPDNTEYRDTLIMRIQHYLYDKKEYLPDDEHSFKPALVNRIDRNTGGIVIAAKTAEALRILNEKLKNREIDKFYLCIVHGCPKKKSDILTGYLSKDEDKNIVKVYDRLLENGRTIRTQYTVVATKKQHSLLKVHLLTGRTHQIRAHMASIGCSLLGDGKYGVNKQDKKAGYKHQALWSYQLKFNFTSDAGELEYLNGKSFQINDVWFVKELYPEINIADI